ncbi:MAG: hypothetical protein HRU13_03100 [Phycisphaerales bacterium]|nr:hypothetical protein [Phycisphaerales bacterium]
MRTVLTAAAVLATAGIAAADTVDLRYFGPGAGGSFDVVANGTSTSVFAGQLNFLADNGTGAGSRLNGALMTYCIDVLEPVGAGRNTYDLTALEDSPVTAGGISPAMGLDKAEAIARMYTFAAGSQFGSDSDVASAFQLAVWEVIADFGGDDPISLTTGDFRVTSAVTLSTQSFLDDLLDAAGDGSISIFQGLGGLTNEGLQDQIFELVIPLPGAAGMAAVGLAGVGLVARRRRS